MIFEITLKTIEGLSKESLTLLDEYTKTSSGKELYKFFESTNWIENGEINKDLFFKYFRYDAHVLHYHFDILLAYKKFEPETIVKLFSQLIEPEYLAEVQTSLKNPEVKRNATWEANHAIIADKFRQFSRDNLRLPTVTELSSATNLSRVTIHKHLQHINTNNHFETQKALYNFGLQNVAAMAYRIGINDQDLKALKLFADIAAKQIAKPAPANFIQINNTKIEVNKFESLPAQAQSKIIEIVANGEKQEPDIWDEAFNGAPPVVLDWLLTVKHKMETRDDGV